MTIAIFGSPYPEHFSKYIQHLIKKLEAEHINLIVEEDFSIFLKNNIRFNKEISTFNSYESLKNKADFLFSIGGDGTLLKAVTYVRETDVPILGINTGRLGFISSISADQIDDAITDILKGNYTINERTLLELSTDKKLFKDKNFALNEVAVSKKDTSSMIRIDAFVDDEFLNTYWADGLVVSTPTGSTGYSLSCGGPIIMPGTNNIIITPNAPHNLNVRPIVIDDNSIIKLKVEDRDQLALVSLDSRSRAFDAETELIIKKANFKTKLVQPQNNSFTTTIRHKLMWGLDKRS
ncbi:MAG: NAD kinase [Flavobacteriales bacterium]|jgi:NAD+ kinase|nr:NAD kinase [Flavobacteriales bacterium]MDG1348246.1 NAD kinase [Flavobacteriales bacterium]|tara:strand:+ start:12273 stop:13151 length:879 start_codon:yes stop_codon:yes gene_type:complete